MHVLFDNGVPRGVASGLQGHVVEEARDRGWDRLENGDYSAQPKPLGSTWPKVADAVAAAIQGSIAEVKIPIE
jgi:hypothetical protein